MWHFSAFIHLLKGTDMRGRVNHVPSDKCFQKLPE